MVAVPTTIFPVSERFIGIARETVPGTPVNPGPTIPLTTFSPSDKPVWIMDEAWRASMAGEYDMLQGPVWTETSFGGPVYGDTIGNLLYNIFGDLVSTGTATANTATINHGGGYPAGTTGAVTVTTVGGTLTAGTYQIDTGVNAELVTVTAAAPTSLTIATGTPTRFAHATGASIIEVTGPFTNTFALLNGGNGQPPSHTFTDRTQVPATNAAAQYAYGCLSQLTLTGSAQGIFMHAGNFTSYVRTFPSAAPTANVSAVRATPNWRSLVGIGGPASGGTLANEITEWEFALNRVVEPIPTNDGSQNPFVIARGKFTGTFKLTYNPAIDETALTTMLANTQPVLQIAYSNGLSSTANITYTINAQLGAFDVANINDSSALFGYDVTGKLIANTTNVGNSGAYGPISISLANNTAIY